MKIKIDNLVRSILQDLAQPLPSQPELAAFFEAIGADGCSRATAQRDVLATWAEDACLPAPIRQYVQQQLDALPAF
ncbi:hypothetical protein KDX27_39205 [Burkholderia cenocepacia]|uniref:hypothetical protein n=1 Tax=Burkholderia cenocepacia TaxID=95486 RepID=UPI001B978D32|nr:hypothetical protein [Burkholderia cenocepacia]MBR8029929.1 hypothetical protein [Burkholderia cenocepacia]MBR8173721.1 hypothetical protein [Burkholderia cenocepacia]